MSRSAVARAAQRARALMVGPRPEAPRETFLALSEYARRQAEDGLGNGVQLPLACYELKVFSQNGEDGVLAEILRRCGSPGRYFVEFGASTGRENNCALLADALGWAGLFVEPGDADFEDLERKYLNSPLVSTVKAPVTPENVDALFRRHSVPAEPDVLSIDVDGADYWIWEALSDHRSRVVVIEFNPALDAQSHLVQPRHHAQWDGTSYFGASLGALAALGRRKGYRLVHTELTGNNAFFVRDDLPGDFPDAGEVRSHFNYHLAGKQHPHDPQRRAFVDLND